MKCKDRLSYKRICKQTYCTTSIRLNPFASIVTLFYTIFKWIIFLYIFHRLNSKHDWTLLFVEKIKIVHKENYASKKPFSPGESTITLKQMQMASNKWSATLKSYIYVQLYTRRFIRFECSGHCLCVPLGGKSAALRKSILQWLAAWDVPDFWRRFVGTDRRHPIICHTCKVGRIRRNISRFDRFYWKCTFAASNIVTYRLIASGNWYKVVACFNSIQ